MISRPCLHSKSRVRIDVGQREEVGGAHEEVAVERVRRDSPSASHAHHRLEADFARQVSENEFHM